MFSSDSTVVEHLPHQPKVKGSCSAADVATGKEEMVKKV
jgi:hypothetical protein